MEDFATTEIRTDATSIFVRWGGKGPPVLLLHGFPQTHLMWQRVAPIFARHWTVVCADLRAYGRSGCPASNVDHMPYSKRTMAHEMVLVMERLGFSRFSVVGHDRGGRVAYRMALDHSNRIERLAVLDILPTSTVWERADAHLALGYWPWSLLAQAEPLPERILTAVPEAIVDEALDGWGSPSSASSAEVRPPTCKRSAIQITRMRFARNTGPRRRLIASMRLRISRKGVASLVRCWCCGAREVL
jgi:haloacetate dehalogenase